MFAKFVVLLAAVFGLAGCTIIRTIDLDPNRPYPTQPSVSATLAANLASKKLQEVPVYVSVARYYDMSNLEGRLAEKEKKEGKDSMITLDDLSRILNPPQTSVENANQFLAGLKSEVDKSGFRRVSVPCEECLIFISDYADTEVSTGATFLMVRVRVYYRGNEVMMPRTRNLWWKPRGRDIALALASKRAVEELLQVWNWRVAAWRQQVSAIQQ